MCFTPDNRHQKRFLIDLNAQGISRVNQITLEHYYLKLLDKLRTMICKLRCTHAVITGIYCTIFIFMTFIQTILGNISNKTPTYIAIYSILSICPAALTALYGMYTHKMKYSEKKMIYEQLIYKLKIEGDKFINWHEERLYVDNEDINECVPRFLEKIKSILNKSIIKVEYDGISNNKISLVEEVMPREIVESFI